MKKNRQNSGNLVSMNMIRGSVVAVYKEKAWQNKGVYAPLSRQALVAMITSCADSLSANFHIF